VNKKARLITAVILALPAGWHIFTFVRIVASRIAYPSDLEWLEGAHLYQAVRLAEGLPVYAPPADGYLPLPYPPMYFAFVGVLGKLFGFDYWAGRLVGALFLSAACIAIGWVVWRHRVTKSSAFDASLALTAGAAVLAAYPLVDGFFDLVRTDTTAVSLCLLAAVGMTPRRRMKMDRTFAIGLLLTLSLFTKHTYAPIVGFMIAFSIVRDWRTGFWISTTTLVTSGIFWITLQVRSHGWFSTWLAVTGGHRIRSEEMAIAVRAILGFAPYLALLPVFVMILLVRKRLSAQSILWLGMLAMALPVCVLSYAKVSGAANNLIAVAMLVAPAGMLVARDLAQSVAPRTGVVLVGACAALYLALRIYDPSPFIPGNDAFERARALNAFIASLDGGVVMPERPFLPIRNGHHNPQLNAIGYADAGNSGMEGASYARDLDKSGAKWVILADPREEWLHEPTLQRYRYERDIDIRVTTIATRRSFPRFLYRRIE
jgi:hypothetical protein